MATYSYRKPLLKSDGKLVKDQLPVMERSIPTFSDVAVGEPETLAYRLHRRKRPFGLRRLAKLAIVTLNRVGGVDQPANVGGVSEHRCQQLPVVLPRAHRQRVPVTPAFTQRQQRHFARFTGGSLVNTFEIGTEGVAIFLGHVLGALADLVDDTALRLGLWKHGVQSVLEPTQAIHASDEHVLDAPVLQFGDDI